jgi:hypothetical protein
VLLHSSTKDEQSGDIDAYIMYDSSIAIARGNLPTIAPLLDAFATMAGSKLADSETLVARASIGQESKSGEVSLIFGAQDSEIANGYTAWGSSGVTRLFDGSPSEKDLTTKPRSSPAKTAFASPRKIIFASKKDGKAKSIELDAAKKLFADKYSFAPADKAAAIFEKLVQNSKAELQVLE